MARKKDDFNMPLAALDMAMARRGGAMTTTGMGKPSASLSAFQGGAGGTMLGKQAGLLGGARGTPAMGMAGGLRTSGPVQPGGQLGAFGGGKGGMNTGKPAFDMQPVSGPMGGALGTISPVNSGDMGKFGGPAGGKGVFGKTGSNPLIKALGPAAGPMGGSIGTPDMGGSAGAFGGKPPVGKGGFTGGPAGLGPATGPMGGALGPVTPGDSLGAFGGGKGAVPTGKGKPGAEIAIDPNMPTGGAIGPVTPGGGPGSYGGSPTGGDATGGNTTGGGTDLDAMYKQVGDARKAALDAAMLNQQQAIAAQGNALGEQYDDMRGQAYTAARISALGNNERMAATGLAGAANAGPQSGYSESSRVAQDTALGNALNAANRQEQSARDDLATQANSARLGRDQQLNETMANLEQQKIQDKMRQDEFGATMEYNKQRDAQQQKNWESEFGFNKEQAQQAQGNWEKQFGESQRQFAEQMGLNRDQFAESQRQFDLQRADNKELAQMDNAWKSISVTGKVSAAAAKLLGIPEGTSSMEAKAMAMQQAQMELQQFGVVKTAATAAILGLPIGTKTMAGTQAGRGGGGGGDWSRAVEDWMNSMDPNGDYRFTGGMRAAAKDTKANTKAAEATQSQNDWYLRGYR